MKKHDPLKSFSFKLVYFKIRPLAEWSTARLFFNNNQINQVTRCMTVDSFKSKK